MRTGFVLWCFKRGGESSPWFFGLAEWKKWKGEKGGGRAKDPNQGAKPDRVLNRTQLEEKRGARGENSFGIHRNSREKGGGEGIIVFPLPGIQCLLGCSYPRNEGKEVRECRNQEVRRLGGGGGVAYHALRQGCVTHLHWGERGGTHLFQRVQKR